MTGTKWTSGMEVWQDTSIELTARFHCSCTFNIDNHLIFSSWTCSFHVNNAVRQTAFLFLLCRLGLENVLILPPYMCVQHHSYFPHVLSCFTQWWFYQKGESPAPSILPCEKCTVHFSGSLFTLYWSKPTIFSMVVRTEWFVGATSLISQWFISRRIKL